MIIFFSLALAFVSVSGSSLSDQIHQTPSDKFCYRGDEPQISCRHEIQDYNVIRWYKQSTDHQMQYLGYTNVNDGYPETGVNVKINGGATKGKTCNLIIEGVDMSSSGVYFCAASRRNYGDPAYFGKGTKLTVLDETPVTPPTVKILQPSEKECKDKTGKKKKTLVCVASGFYPDHVGVSWTRNDLKITDGVSTDAAAKRGKDNYYKITSRLTIPINDWLKPNIEFKCIVSFYNGTANIERDDVFKTKGVDNPGMTRANYLKITQNAKLSYSALIVKSLLYAALVGLLVWKLQGKRGKQTK